MKTVTQVKNKVNIRTYLSLDNLINYFILLQIVSTGFSVAVSSISLGVWVVLWVYRILNEKDFRGFTILFSQYRFFIIGLAGFILTELLSRIFAVFPEEALIGMKRYLLVLCFFANQGVLKSRKDLFRNLIIITAGFSILSTVEIIRFILTLSENLKSTSFSEIRIDYFGYPITAGEIKMLVLMVMFPLILSKKNHGVRKIYIIGMLIPVLVSLFLTQSRNVYLGVLISLFIYGIFVNWRFLVSYLLFLCILWVVMPGAGKERIKSIFDLQHPSNKSRLVMWNVGMQVFKDYPVLGTGDNEITQVYKMYKTPESHGEGSHFHSNPVMILVTSGSAGAFFYLFLWAAVFAYAIKDYLKSDNTFDKEVIMGIIIAMISFHISGIFEWNFGDWEVATVMFYLISLIFALKYININKTEYNGQEQIN